MHFCFYLMWTSFVYTLFFGFSGIRAAACGDEIKLRQNTSLTHQKEECLTIYPQDKRHIAFNKTKGTMHKNFLYLQKINQKYENMTLYCKNSSLIVQQSTICYILSLSHDMENIVSNINEYFKSKKKYSHANSSTKLLIKNASTLKHQKTSRIHHFVEKREINSEKNDSVASVNYTKYLKDLSNVRKSPEFFKNTTQVTTHYDKNLENSNATGVGYTSMRYCKQYQKYALEKTYATPLLPVLKPFVVGEQRKCFILPLVVGGKEASRGEFPHMASLGYNTGKMTHFLCGASLISERYVLTAAHCAKTKWGFPVVVRFGVLNVFTERGQTIPVDDVIIHPNYKEPSVYDDIALVRIAEKLRLGHNLRPACLPQVNTESENPGSVVTAIGWGKVGYNSFLSPHLLKVQLKVVSLPKCEETFVNKERSVRLRNGISKNMICATGYLNPRHDTCQGDSGGPLQITYTDSNTGYCTHEIIGITSFGKQCGTGIPGVYTRVSAYIGWIESVVWSS